MLQELLGQQGVGRDFAHHDDLQPVLAALQPLTRQLVHHRFRLVHGTHERDHDFDVGQPHVVAHALHRITFQREAVAEAVGHVASGPAEAQHRVLFFRLVALAADQVGVFVRLKVRQAHNHAFRIESGTQRRDPFGQTADVELFRRVVAFHHLADFVLQLRLLVVKLQQRTRVNADHTVDDKFQARQAYAFVRQAGEVERAVRVADVHHDLQRQVRHGIHAGALHAEVEDIGIHVAGIAFGTGDGHILSVLHALGSITAADNRRNPQLAGNDRRVAGTTAAVGNDSRRFLHDRFPVRVGHVGHQHVAWLNAVHLADVVDHLHRTGTDAVTDSTAFRHDFALGVQRVTLHHLTA